MYVYLSAKEYSISAIFPQILISDSHLVDALDYYVKYLLTPSNAKLIFYTYICLYVRF